ncbi:NAD(P)-binding domain-containing protein [Stackebrandtia nassauensis]|uniref:FAD-dependent pyridine nucleotide-disulfide oxidoreductase n=1 Tax=Stackebrandtia nassauensis (strain DSM 44728 / CIP 108903 / NRRL B-16338 / NBRC 102104 / LLR-40K-21) TaxID=446470 RepID=D3PZD0_STANL|nr:NAD(P)-binding domain-containing protein [Stackebrandtia nassauensis]ADD41604.1 FAD-dependent pyridine nucleotide-disulfide oxidoreductase [Stackebrandtia nassauensis DSM 44728]
MNGEVDIAVIGAGQAGLSSGYFARRAGLEPGSGFVVFDHAPAPGGAWQFRWPTLTFTTVHGIYRLPGMEMAPQDASAPVAPAVSDYFREYENRFDLRVHRPVDVHRVSPRADGRLDLATSEGDWIARGVINATGTWEKPFWPRYPGADLFRGRQLHTADYRGPDEFAGKRVVIVGGGASAIQHLLEIARVADTTWVTRRDPEFTERPFDIHWGREVIARVEDRVRRGLPPESVVKATGYQLTPEIKAAREAGILHRRPMFERLTPEGVAWEDGSTVAADVVLWATGFRAALDHLAPLRLREPGGGIRMEGTRVVADPRIHLVGYGPSASTIGANRAGRAAVRELRRHLAEREPALAS